MLFGVLVLPCVDFSLATLMQGNVFVSAFMLCFRLDLSLQWGLVMWLYGASVYDSVQPQCATVWDLGVWPQCWAVWGMVVWQYGALVCDSVHPGCVAV